MLANLSGSRRVAQAHNIADLRSLARSRMPKVIFDYLDGGADDEVTLERNRTAFDSYAINGHMLIDVADVSTETEILGQKIGSPIILSSTGANRMFHTDGELAAARAASNAGTIFATASTATTSLEDVAAASSGQKWFQLYPWKDRQVMKDHMKRCAQAGYSTMVLTVDCATAGNRERDFYNGFSFPMKLSPRRILDGLLHPAWSWDYLTSETLSFPNVSDLFEAAGDVSSIVQWFGDQLDSSFTWRDAAEIRSAWDGPFVVKGITCVSDAEQAIEIGASAIVVSNHGGRQLDHAPSTLGVLPEIATAVGHRAEILLDSGIRRGTDIIKALALGAKAVLIGRPYLYGLGAGGQAGVERSIEILTSELVRDMKLMGVTNVAGIGQERVRKL